MTDADIKPLDNCARERFRRGVSGGGPRAVDPTAVNPATFRVSLLLTASHETLVQNSFDDMQQTYTYLKLAVIGVLKEQIANKAPEHWVASLVSGLAIADVRIWSNDFLSHIVSF